MHVAELADCVTQQLAEHPVGVVLGQGRPVALSARRIEPPVHIGRVVLGEVLPEDVEGLQTTLSRVPRDRRRAAGLLLEPVHTDVPGRPRLPHDQMVPLPADDQLDLTLLTKGRCIAIAAHRCQQVPPEAAHRCLFVGGEPRLPRTVPGDVENVAVSGALPYAFDRHGPVARGAVRNRASGQHRGEPHQQPLFPRHERERTVSLLSYAAAPITL